ncbi:preprotein translocase subunit SecE [Coxiella burnetii]|uniref:preprotein translocase subunit SecE n=1 Tax=Coxiella burnetii TaxID=777 RepID=UPI0000DAEA55|nr:preprotein translocase subunit SecE [Coxiella burnetii]ABX79120.1 preprotein translocase, SecE subunit [Coxiella burnetii RSA 331]ATN81453.1 preprotein translocase subunit SecE [Coxiella burnetii]ATN83356.1 preprotein translocase subunit SecE [Coxiella burnetii]MDE3401534.1 preprotein translocase subunit SecE [Coxiella burnetii]POZ79849.1 preprotein translocase subunit SecE [Coxiella burnetii]
MAQQSVTPEKKSRFDGLKWLLIVALLVAAIVAEFYYSQVAWAIRAAVGIVVVVILLAIASQTDKGRRAWGFIKNARAELRKVVWPTRQETLRTTLVVIVMVVITALILWGLDSFFMWAIGWMAGQRG